METNIFSHKMRYTFVIIIEFIEINGCEDIRLMYPNTQ